MRPASRVVHLCPTHFGAGSVIAGAERYSYHLAHAVARWTETTLVTFGPESFVRQEGGLTIRCFRPLTYAKGLKGNPFSVGFLRALWGAEIIHCLQFKTLTTDLAILFGAATRKKVFVTDLGGATDLSLSYHLPLWRGVTSFLLISEFSHGFYRELPVEARVIYGGVDADLFSPGDASKGAAILFVGRILPSKGIDVVIRALAPEMELCVIGQPYDGGYLDQLRSLSTGKRVEFQTDVSDDQLILKYRQARLTVIPSLVDGGYTTAMESMACGTPVVATNVGSLPELVEDGVTGFIVPPREPSAMREKIELLLSNPDLAGEMGRRGRERVLSRFTWDAVARRCLDAYGLGSKGDTTLSTDPSP